MGFTGFSAAVQRLWERWLRGEELSPAPKVGLESSQYAELNKIDGAATLGLSGTHNSLAYRVNEIETHLHSYERAFGAAVTPNGELHVADQVGPGVNPFEVDAGNNDWGVWVQILGSGDTPFITGSQFYDLNEITFIAAERDETYFVEIAFGESGAAALAAGDYSVQVYKPASNALESGPSVFQNRREPAGTKAWARCMCLGQNTATLSFYPALHEYPG